MGLTTYELDPYGNFKPDNNRCECCSPKMSSATVTATTHKWTREEIVENVLYFAAGLANARWYERGQKREVLKHWTDKLDRLNELESEFK